MKEGVLKQEKAGEQARTPPQPTPYSPQPAIHHPQFTAHSPQPTTANSPPHTVHSPQSTARASEGYPTLKDLEIFRSLKFLGEMDG